MMGIMSRIPDFANIAFENTARVEPAGGAEPWLTPEGISVKPGYSEADLEGIDFLETWPGIAPYLRGRRGTGRAAGETLGDHSERHSERVHGPQHLHLSAGALDADHLRHFCVYLAKNAEIQLHIHLRLSHAGGRRDPGPRARLYAGRRRRISPRRARGGARCRPLRTAAVVLLGDRHEFFHGSREDARRAAVVGQAVDPIQSEGRALAVAAHALPDFGLVADRAGCLQQRDAHHHRGDGGNPGPYAITAHQCARRGPCAADRFLGQNRAPYATGPAA